MKRVLVTGASGFVGYQSLAPLVARGFDVIAVTSRTVNLPFQDVTWAKADLMDPVVCGELLAAYRPEFLLHFAWYAEPGRFWTSPENFRWVQASLGLLEQFAKHGGRRVVSAGSCAEYDWSAGHCLENQSVLSPATTYGICKHAMQLMQSEFCKQAGISQAWGRIFLTYGPREDPRRLVASVINSLLEYRPARCSHGGQIRDLMHVQDVAEAFVALLDSEVEGAVNVASGNPVALKEVIGTIANLLERADLVQLGAIPSSLDEPGLLTADTGRLRSEVGWTPRYDLESGLDQTIDWWKSRSRWESREGAVVV